MEKRNEEEYSRSLLGELTVATTQDESCDHFTLLSTPLLGADDSSESHDQEFLAAGGKKVQERKFNSRINVNRKALNNGARWEVLCLLCIILLCGHICKDEPASLHSQFDDWMKDSNHFEFKFDLLYSLVDFPNIILPLFAGPLVDRHGAWQMLVVFCSFSLIGQFLFAVGVQNKSWSLMYAGRILFGIGGDNIVICKSVLLACWFPDNQLALAFGIGTSIGRIGTVLSNSLAPILANSVSLPFSIWVAFATAVVMFMASLRIGSVEARTDEQTNDDECEMQEHVTQCGEEDAKSTSSAVDSMIKSANIKHHEVHLKEVFKFGPIFWLTGLSVVFIYGCFYPFNFAASGILMERNYFKDPASDCKLTFPDQCTEGTLAPIVGNPSYDEDGNECPSKNYSPVLPTSLNVTKENTSWDDAWDEDEYVFDSLDSDDVSCSDDFWSEACTKDYCDDKDDATEKAGLIMSIPFIFGAVLAAPFGFLSDYFGYRLVWATLSPAFLIIEHFTLAYSSRTPVWPMISSGLGFAIYCAVIWPTIALTTELKYTGLAYGVVSSILNIGTSSFPLIVATLYENNGNEYLPDVEIFFATSAICGMVIGIVMNIIDYRTGGNVNSIAKNIATSVESNSSSR